MSAFWLIFWADVLAQIIRQMAKADTAHASDRGLAYRTSQAVAKKASLPSYHQSQNWDADGLNDCLIKTVQHGACVPRAVISLDYWHSHAHKNLAQNRVLTWAVFLASSTNA